ncbi:MAG: hypothetical protein JSV84_14460 [Gemmatimonadota bacterium]|nr:MAG: hypothetical protein JSV84_14460 [Gemmatimonadota bacterium]
MRRHIFYAGVFVAILLSTHTVSHSERINPTAAGSPARNHAAPSATQSNDIQFLKPAFWTRRLINLPTTQTLFRGELLFRIAHRYNRALRDGEDHLFGLDGPAKILLSLGYGIRDNVSVTLGRTNLSDVVELSCNWRFIEQGKRYGVPLSASLNVGGSLETERCEDIWESDNLKFSAQLSLSHQASESFALLLVPAYSSNTNPSASSSEGTLILGLGGRFTFVSNLSLIWESLPHLSGYEAESQGWGAGLEYKTGGHVFQVFLTNMLGLTSDQFIPGGDFKITDSDYRLGFNIFRSFWF